MNRKELMQSFNPWNICRLFNKFTRNNSIIFMMHRFQDPSINYKTSFSQTLLSPNILDKSLKYLVNNGYTVLTFKDLVQATKTHQKFYKTICFTIDDGYIDFKNIAFPLFKKYNLPATVFITTDFIEGKLTMWWDIVEYLIVNTKLKETAISYENVPRKIQLGSLTKKNIAIKQITQKLKLLPLPKILLFLQYLSKQLNVEIPDKSPKQYRGLHWNDILEMKGYGIDFQPHTATHPILSHINVTDQEWQIKMSTETLKNKIRSHPNIFCYPNGKIGDFTEKTISILKRENFVAACTAEHNIFTPGSTDLFQIPRLPFPDKYYKFILYVTGCKALQLAIKDKITHILRYWPWTKSKRT